MGGGWWVVGVGRCWRNSGGFLFGDGFFGLGEELYGGVLLASLFRFFFFLFGFGWMDVLGEEDVGCEE